MNALPFLKLRALASPFLFLLTVALATMLSGCSEDDSSTGPGDLRVFYPPDLMEVIAPDSAEVGDTVELVAWISIGGCQQAEGAVLTELEPGYGRVQLLASRPFKTGTCNTGIWGVPLTTRVPIGTAGTWRFDVVGRTSESVEVVVTSRVEVVSRESGRAIPGDTLTVFPVTRRLDDFWDVGTPLRSGIADSMGTLRIDLMGLKAEDRLLLRRKSPRDGMWTDFPFLEAPPADQKVERVTLYF